MVPNIGLLTLLLLHYSFSFPTANFEVTGRRPTETFLFNFGGVASGGAAKIPSSISERDNQAIAAVKAAVQNPRDSRTPLIECEFPALAAQNKLGDGSLRSAIEAEDATIAFVKKLVNGIAPTPFFGSNISLVVSSGVSNSFLKKAQKVKGATLCSLRDGPPQAEKGGVCIFVTPSSQKDYQTAKSLAKSGCSAVILNGFAKDRMSVPGSATMAYFLKPLTYNSQIAGYLIRSYPSSWTVLDAETKDVLGSFSDDEILVKNTNTPDLRNSGRLVQKSVDERAIRARANII